jgi:histidine ammonia-lyase
MKIFYFGEDHLTPHLAFQIATNKLTCEIGKRAKVNIQESRKNTLDIAHSEHTVYGINTGFGPLCDTRISKEQIKLLQKNILKSHSVGVGPIVPDLIAKLMLITKVHALSMGYSGISLEVLERIVFFIQYEIIPEVPSQVSVGASGDLAPLAHLFLPIMGLGKVKVEGKIMSAAKMHNLHHLDPLPLGAKEGLALINGTQFILSYAVLGLSRLYNCLEAADIIGAMSLEGLLGSISPFTKELHELRPFEGSQLVAARMNTLLSGSEMVASHENCDRVQDPYSLRCIPQVHGASRNAWSHLNELVITELNSVTDNPIILNAQTSISGGNFHGQLLAMPLDYAGLAAAEIGNISDRRTYLLLEGKTAGLPRLLMKNTGINSGFMIPQYTSAALASENKGLCWPASADSIPTSLGQEDHVSMGSISGRKLNTIIDNLEHILAIELICAAQAFDYHKPLKSGLILDHCHELIRTKINHAEEDRIFSEDIKLAHELISSGALIKKANDTAQAHHIDLGSTVG